MFQQNNNYNISNQPNNNMDQINKENSQPMNNLQFMQKNMNNNINEPAYIQGQRNALDHIQPNTYNSNMMNYSNQPQYDQQENLNTPINSNCQNNNQISGNQNMDDQIQAVSINYIDYDNLPQFPQNINVNEITGQIMEQFKCGDWTKKFASIDNLRIINKYYPSDSNQIFQMFWNQILQCLEDKKTCIEKNIMNQLREAFYFKRDNMFHDKILTDVLPQLISKSIHSTTKFMKSLADETQSYLCNNYVNDQVIQCLARNAENYCNKKDSECFEKAMFWLANIIQTLGDQISQVNSVSLQAIFYILVVCLRCHCRKNFELAKKIAAYICNIMTYNNYIVYCEQLYTNNVIDENAVILQKNCLSNKNNKDPKRQSISEQRHNFKSSVKKSDLQAFKYKEMACKSKQQILGCSFGQNNNQNFNHGQQNSNQNCNSNSFFNNNGMQNNFGGFTNQNQGQLGQNSNNTNMFGGQNNNMFFGQDTNNNMGNGFGNGFFK